LFKKINVLDSKSEESLEEGPIEIEEGMLERPTSQFKQPT
jgi:hypothetical protein